MNRKVFSIGLHKTGTSSLFKALEILGYQPCRRLKMLQKRLVHDDIIDVLKQKEHDKIFDVTEGFDAFVDNPWPLLYKEVDRHFPNSQFILTIRDEQEWIESVLNYFSGYETKIRELIYGVSSPQNNEEIFLKKYREHNASVIEYFNQRPDQLLVINIDKGLSWKPLCSFLNKDIPDIEFPFRNKNRFKNIRELTTSEKKDLSFKKAHRFIKLDLKQQFIYLETFLSLSVSRLLILILPFRRLAKFMGREQSESNFQISETDLRKVKEIGKIVKKVSLYVPYRSQCFEQALVIKFMLNRRGISSTIYFGVANDDPHQLKAHAWVRSGNYIVSGNRGKELFSSLSHFS